MENVKFREVEVNIHISNNSLCFSEIFIEYKRINFCGFQPQMCGLTASVTGSTNDGCFIVYTTFRLLIF